MRYRNQIMSRRAFLRVATGSVASLAALPILAGCTPVAAPAESTTGGQQESAGAPPQEPLVITMHIQAGWVEAVPGMYARRPAAYMEEHPNIKIEMVPIPGGEYDAKLLTLAASGNIADTMHTSDVWTQHTRMVKLGILRSADEYLDAQGISKDEWLPAAQETLTHDGLMYGIPKTCHPGDAYIWINEDLFIQAGLPVPQTYGNSLDDIAQWAETLAQGPADDRDVYGYMPRAGGIQAIVNGVRQFGTYENNEDGTQSLADNEQWFQWANWVKSFYDHGLATVEAALPSGGADALFLAGRLAMRHNQRYFYRRVNVGMKEVEKPFSWSVIQYPRGGQDAKGWGASVDTHSVSTASKHPVEATDFCYAMADRTFARFVAEDQGYLTARVDDLETVKDIIYPFLELQYQCMTEEEKFRQPANARGTEVETVYRNELDKLWLGDAELAPAFMEDMKAAADEVMAKPF